MITLQLSRQLDDHDLSECAVLNNALEEYRQSLKKAESEGLCYPAYFQRAFEIINGLRFEMVDALLKPSNLEMVLVDDNQSIGKGGQAND